MNIERSRQKVKWRLQDNSKRLEWSALFVLSLYEWRAGEKSTHSKLVALVCCHMFWATCAIPRWSKEARCLFTRFDAYPILWKRYPESSRCRKEIRWYRNFTMAPSVINHPVSFWDDGIMRSMICQAGRTCEVKKCKCNSMSESGQNVIPVAR